MLAGALAGRTAFLLPAPSLRLLLPPLTSLTGLLLGLRLAGTPSLRSLLLSSPGPTPSGKRRCLRLLGWTLPLFLLLQGLQLLLAKLIPPAGETLSPPLAPALLLSSCFLAPCAEELLYRRLLPDALTHRGFPRLASHFLSALLFAVAHGNPRAFLSLVLFSLSLSALQEREDTLQAILVHGAFNALTLLSLALFSAS